ncbi:MAG: hypothetical protein ABII90_01720 [Bacteroidota bacterium]
MANKIEKAKIKFSDLDGTLAVDYAGDFGITTFKNYAEAIGIDLEKYDPQGIEIYSGEHTKLEDISITIIAIDKKKRKDYSAKNNGRLPVVKIHDADKFFNCVSFIQKIHVIAFKGHEGESNNPDNLDVIEDIYPSLIK